jgi:hypothetical protein
MVGAKNHFADLRASPARWRLSYPPLKEPQTYPQSHEDRCSRASRCARSRTRVLCGAWVERAVQDATWTG